MAPSRESTMIVPSRSTLASIPLLSYAARASERRSVDPASHLITVGRAPWRGGVMRGPRRGRRLRRARTPAPSRAVSRRQRAPLGADGLSLDLRPGATLGTLGLEAGQVVLLSRRSLVIPAAGLRVDLAGASPWEPRPRPGRTSPHELARRARRARALTVAEGSSPSLLPLLWVSGSTDLPSEPARSAAPAAAVLRAAAVGADPDGVRRAAASLAGLGP